MTHLKRQTEEYIISTLSHHLNASIRDSITESGPNFFPLVVVTPGVAHLIEPSNSFLGTVLANVSSQCGTPRSIPIQYAAAAVVDKIPDPDGILSKRDNETEEFEGVSLLMVQPHEVQWKAALPRRISGPIGEEPNLVISVQSGGTTGAPAHEVGLRLAHTIFTNGRDRTLLGMRFVANEGDGGQPSFTMDKVIELSSCTVATKGPNFDIQSTFPLDPVTPRRRVLTSMGNILRQVAKSTDPNSNEPIPASQELEKELPRYIDEHDIADQRVSVWALVEKPHLEGSESKSPQDRIQESLSQGGKLHRVMSGGGGWGKKQGLLSLDPEVSFPGVSRSDEPVLLDCIFDPTADASLNMPAPFPSEMPSNDLSRLSQVAAPGDLIQFFVSTPPSHTTIPEGESGVTYCFGVVSPVDETNGVADDIRRSVSIPKFFGALSEQAIAYSQPIGHSAEGQRSSTKLDIPGSRVIFLSGGR